MAGFWWYSGAEVTQLLSTPPPPAVLYPLVRYQSIAHNPQQKKSDSFVITALYPAEVPIIIPISERVVAHSSIQKEMQAISLLPIADEIPPEPPPVIEDIPPISQVITSGHGW